MLYRNRFCFRCLHTSRNLFQSAQSLSKLGKGKKIAPQKQSLVILDAKQSNLLRRRKIPEFFDIQYKKPYDPSQDESFKILGSRNSSKKLSQTENFKIFDHFKPRKNAISEKRYEQLINDLSKSFTSKQIKEYIDISYPQAQYNKRATKNQLLNSLIVNGWKIEINDTINPEDDLITERIFDFNVKELFILMWISPFDEWIRANVEILVIPEELRVIVKATKPHLQYIEISIDRMLKNVKSEYVSLEKIMKISQNSGLNIPITDIQRISGVFIEKFKQSDENENPDEKEGDNNYTMYALGHRKFSDFRRLILWSLEDYSSVKTNIHADFQNLQFKHFNLFTDPSLPWINRRKQWLRLKQPVGLNSLPAPISIDTKKVHDELYIPNPNKTPRISTSNEQSEIQSITAVTLGHLLFREPKSTKVEPKNFIMNTNIPFAHQRILSLNPYRPVEDDFDSETLVDHHSYFARIKFQPSPFLNNVDIQNFPPLEFWLEIDENDKASTDTLQVLSIVEERNSIVSLPGYTTDMKFTRSDTEVLIKPYDGTESWLSDQPGVKKFLENSRLDFSGETTVKVWDYVEMNLPGVEESVRYDYVSMTYRRHLDLKYKDRLLQYAVVEGGALGGRTSEVILIGKESEMNLAEFEQFTEDSVEFVKSLNPA